jgi:uncharacterized protein (DUF362 family)
MCERHHPNLEKEVDKEPQKTFSRRDFLGALGVSSAGLLLGACGKAKAPVEPADTTVKAGSAEAAMRHPLAVPSAQARVATANVSTYDYQTLRQNIESMFKAIGGISNLVSGKTVGMKINLTAADSTTCYNRKVPAVESYWTHPEIVRVVGELVKDAGAGKIVIIEAPYDPKFYRDFGFEDVANYIGATIVNLNQKDPYMTFADRQVGDGWLIYEEFTQNAILNDLECVISLPKPKQHVGAGFTSAMKNLVGTIPLGGYGGGDTWRSEIHQHREYDNNPNSNLRRVVLDLNLATKIHLAVTDAIKTALGGENPGQRTFKPATFNKLIASKDVVAADSIGCQVIGFDPMAADDTGVFKDGINYLRLAQEKGMGTYDLAQIEVVDATVSTGIQERKPL